MEDSNLRMTVPKTVALPTWLISKKDSITHGLQLPSLRYEEGVMLKLYTTLFQINI